MMTLAQGASKIVNQCASVKAGENVVILTDDERPLELSESLALAAKNAGANTIQIIFDGKLINGQLCHPASRAIEIADVVICVTTRTMAYTKAVDICRMHGGRMIAMTESDISTFTQGALEADYYSLKPVIEHVKSAFDRADLVKVTSERGTDLTLSVKGRIARTCSGFCTEPGDMIGLPDVEVYIAPLEHETKGVLVADASGSGLGILNEPIRFYIENGSVIKIEGGNQSKQLEKRLAMMDDPTAYIIAEFAVGLNPCGNLTGNISVDEGLYGTGHFALGNNLGFGGMNDAPEHLDMVYWHPSIWLDGKLFMKDGELIGYNQNT